MSDDATGVIIGVAIGSVARNAGSSQLGCVPKVDAAVPAVTTCAGSSGSLGVYADFADDGDVPYIGSCASAARAGATSVAGNAAENVAVRGAAEEAATDCAPFAFLAAFESDFALPCALE